MKTRILIISLIFLTHQVSWAATCASDGSSSSVQTCHSQVSDGDTITIPCNQSNTWVTPVTLSKAITLQGCTTVTGTHADGGQNPPIQANPVVNDSSIIVDGNPDRNHSAVLNLSAPAGKIIRVTGITFKHGTLPQTTGSNGNVLIGGLGAVDFRIDHCHWDHPSATAIYSYAAHPGGVIDHNVFDVGGTGFNYVQSIHLENCNSGEGHGDDCWTETSQFGTSHFTFIEDNYFHFGDPNLGSGGGIDCYRGGKYVARYNTVRNMNPQSHGTDSAGRVRGVRATEVYNNVHLWDNGAYQWPEFRGGDSRYHDNGILYSPFNLTGAGASAGCFRSFIIYSPFSGAFANPARGNSVWDNNDVTDHTGNGFGGGPNGLYASGTVGGPNSPQDGGAGTQSTVPITGNPWSPNQWQLTPDGGRWTIVNASTGKGSWIISNTSGTATYYYFTEGGDNLDFTTGQGYEIRHVLDAMDTPGHGAGDLINDAITSTTSPVTLPVSNATIPVVSTSAFPAAPLTIGFNGFSNAINCTGKTSNSFTGCTGGTGGSFSSGTAVYALINVATGTQAWPRQIRAPIYAWNNLWNGVNVPAVVKDIIVPNRDIINNTQAPGYTPYCYPHPLVSGNPCATPTPTATATPTATYTPTPTPTATPSATATFTPTPTPTATPSATFTPTPTSTPTPTPTPLGTPTAPTGLKIESPCATPCDLIWNPNPLIENVLSYNIYRVNNPDSVVGNVLTPNVKFDVSPFLNLNRTKFYLKAVNANGEGLKSSTITVKRH